MAVAETRSTCCYCGVGCGVLIASDGVQVTGVRGDPDHPANFGRLCSKGSTLHLTAQPLLQQQVRALYPEMRRDRNQERERVSWDVALDHLAEQFHETIQRHGRDSVAFYISGQLLTEDYYVFNKLAKGLIGTNNIDSNSRLCMSSAVAGYKQTLGADAPPNCYEDLELAETIFIVGSNMAFAHPVLYRRIEAARSANPDLKVIVADPRRTDTAKEADLFLPILPGTDVALFNGMLHICLWEGLIDAAYIDAHTEGFAALKQTVASYTPAMVATTCGIDEADLWQAARWFGSSRATMSLYCQGLNQSSSGTAKNAALINLHLATHQIGKPGAGPFSLTGQPNAMGGREVGGMANLMSAHRDMANPAQRAEVAALWGVDNVPDQPGKTAVDMFAALRSGEIKIIWIACTNPAQSMPDQELIRQALMTAELVIVQEAYQSTATVPYADVLLPASSWGEKEGTVTNSERRISRVRAAVAAPGLARHDQDIVVQFARRLEAKMQRPTSLFAYSSSEAIWNEHRESTRGTDIDITGLSYALLEQQGPQQWPFPAGATSGKKRLYEDGLFPTKTGRAQFINTLYQPVAEAVTAKFPLHLTTGRLRDQWHGMSRSGTVAQLFSHASEPVINLSAADMERRGIQDGDLVRVESARGNQIFPAQRSDSLRTGQSFIAMHWGEEYVSGRTISGKRTYGVNNLTLGAIDPVSKQPELKHAAINIRLLNLPWRFFMVAWVAADQLLQLQTTLRAYLPSFDYASCTLTGHDQVGIVFRAASREPVPLAIQSELRQLLGLEQASVLKYEDASTGHGRHLLVRDGLLQALALAGDIRAESWLREYWQQQQSVTSLGQRLLIPGAQPPAGLQPRGRIVCTCMNVAESAIVSWLQQNKSEPEHCLAQLQQQLLCGTGCGSCVPELKQMVKHAQLN